MSGCGGVGGVGGGGITINNSQKSPTLSSQPSSLIIQQQQLTTTGTTTTTNLMSTSLNSIHGNGGSNGHQHQQLIIPTTVTPSSQMSTSLHGLSGSVGSGNNVGGGCVTAITGISGGISYDSSNSILTNSSNQLWSNNNAGQLSPTTISGGGLPLSQSQSLNTGAPTVLTASLTSSGPASGTSIASSSSSSNTTATAQQQQQQHKKLEVKLNAMP